MAHDSSTSSTDEAAKNVRLRDYLEGDELNLIKHGGIVPGEYRSHEVERMIAEDGEESSFVDDEVPPSEDEFFSSDWKEDDDVLGYVPPLSRRKRTLMYKLMLHEIKPDDKPQDIASKRQMREQAINRFRSYLLKKRSVKAYKRFKKLQEANIEDHEQAAFFLEKLELQDKKLLRPYYYEQHEPWCYTYLLRKRKKAIRRKYEMYAMDEDYRNDMKDRAMECIRHIIRTEDEDLINFFSKDVAYAKTEKAIELLDQAAFLLAKEQERFITTAWSGVPPKEKQKEVKSEDSESSFYDDQIAYSELSFFSSDWEEEKNYPRPEPPSRTLDKYYRMKNKTIIFGNIDPREKKKNFLKRAEINVQFRNYVEKKRYTKALARFATISKLKITDPKEQAKRLLDMEILDKKLHRKFYYVKHEPKVYKKLLGKRRRAVQRKYELFAKDPEFREQYKAKVYENYLRIQPAPLFEKETSTERGSDVSSISSFNDSDIPWSEEKYFSEEDYVKPYYKKKPITRTKKALFDRLQKYEVNPLTDSPSGMLKKRKNRLRIIYNFKRNLINRRFRKAGARLRKVNKLGFTDIAVRAKALQELEIEDKKLDRGYYYAPWEPKQFKELLKRRLEAIERKYIEYRVRPEVRQHLEQRWYTDARILVGSGRLQEEVFIHERYQDQDERIGYDDRELTSSDESETQEWKFPGKVKFSKTRKFIRLRRRKGK